MIFQKLMLGISAVAMTATPAMAHSTGGKGHEPILTRPISDIPDDYWYDYLADIREAEHELVRAACSPRSEPPRNARG